MKWFMDSTCEGGEEKRRMKKNLSRGGWGAAVEATRGRRSSAEGRQRSRVALLHNNERQELKGPAQQGKAVGRQDQGSTHVVHRHVFFSQAHPELCGLGLQPAVPAAQRAGRGRGQRGERTPEGGRGGGSRRRAAQRSL